VFLCQMFYEDWMPHQVSGRYDAPRFIDLFSDFTRYSRARRFRSPCGLGALNRLFLPRAARPRTRLAAGIHRELEGEACVPEPAQAGAADQSRLGCRSQVSITA
jgi:hypothetical protein